MRYVRADNDFNYFSEIIADHYAYETVLLPPQGQSDGNPHRWAQGERSTIQNSRATSSNDSHLVLSYTSLAFLLSHFSFVMDYLDRRSLLAREISLPFLLACRVNVSFSVVRMEYPFSSCPLFPFPIYAKRCVSSHQRLPFCYVGDVHEAVHKHFKFF